MTASSTGRIARRRARREEPLPRGDGVLLAASTLAAMAATDPTVTGGTLFMPDGSCRYVSLSDARAIVGIGEPAGRA